MGGHAFRNLNCPRIPPDIYFKVRDQTTSALRKLLTHVVIPTEMPAKPSYGDVEFLVSAFLPTSPASATVLDYPLMISIIKDLLHTPHGKRGYLNPDVMYFAVPVPGLDSEVDTWIQIDVKVCDAEDEQGFAWHQFQPNYASRLKMIGSLMKPLGLTISPSGLHVRVEEMEGINFAGSMVFVSREAGDVLRVLGLDRRFLHGGFGEVEEEVYQYFASTWIFNPAHYAARLEEEKYQKHIEDRAAPWVYFLTEWVPAQFTQYPGYRIYDDETSLEEWRERTRAAVKEKVFTMFPGITQTFYTKRAAHLREVEEGRLRQVLMEAIPEGLEGWSEDIARPRVVVQEPGQGLVTPPLNPTRGDAPTWVNYVGMWRKRFEKEEERRGREEREAAKLEREKAEVEAKRERILARLKVLNGVGRE
ncbi:hypothetical protein BU23DRAFT_587284 [Bimuria novae-zelandiae CBS 107.79]|uniref:Uncharacterized protein n=1 Tax=Bimuria novae-zelandiae CBS 107.79 TaxID=1447943 RepID=A0A6A5VKE2_9PLEO|nr:hypothetical protein BU23DRAFT_587284 [Bimuria novae-zelandiae CBS 107.79]